jgi:uncharacterized cupredoxin-like copper-binding protein
MRAILAAAMLLLAGCAGAPDPAATSQTTTASSTHPAASACPPKAYDGSQPDGRILSFKVVEPSPGQPCFLFKGPMAASSGWNTLRFVNNGAAPHVMVLLRVEGRTFQAVVEEFMKEGAEQPDWVHEAGGVGLLGPGRTAEVEQYLQPGTYAMFCWVHGHAHQGMFQELQVLADKDGGEAPVPDLNLTLTDFGFKFDQPVKAGTRTIAIHNAGRQPHEAPILRLFGNATVEEFAKAFEEGHGDELGIGVGGVNTIQPGQTVFVRLKLEAGRYGLICFVHDPESHKAHSELGMVHHFEAT